MFEIKKLEAEKKQNLKYISDLKKLINSNLKGYEKLEKENKKLKEKLPELLAEFACFATLKEKQIWNGKYLRTAKMFLKIKGMI